MELEDYLIQWNEIKGYDDLIEHNNRVGKLAFNLSKSLNFSRNECEEIRVAGSLHDVGKLFIPRDILYKHSKLNKSEFEYMKKHSLYTYLILRHVGISENISNIAKLHHENMDGSGYPFGLKGNEIPKGSRILKVCDVFDALTNERVYRKKYTISQALIIMLNEKSKYDYNILNTFFNNMGKNLKGVKSYEKINK